jgi:hypothetical protein
VTPLGAGPEGYKDFQRIANYDGPLLASLAQVKKSGQVKTPRLQVSRFATLWAIAEVTENAPALEFEWFSAASGGSSIGSRIVWLTEHIGRYAVLSLPNFGPWVQVSLFTNVNYSATASIFASNRTQQIGFQPIEPMVMALNEPVKAGETKDLYPSSYASGPAQINARALTQNGTFAIEALTEPGLWVPTYVSELAGGGAPLNTQVVLPLGAWRVSVTNGTGVEASYIVRITPSSTGSS